MRPWFRIDAVNRRGTVVLSIGEQGKIRTRNLVVERLERQKSQNSSAFCIVGASPRSFFGFTEEGIGGWSSGLFLLLGGGPQSLF